MVLGHASYENVWPWTRNQCTHMLPTVDMAKLSPSSAHSKYVSKASGKFFVTPSPTINAPASMRLATSLERDSFPFCSGIAYAKDSTSRFSFAKRCSAGRCTGVEQTGQTVPLFAARFLAQASQNVCPQLQHCLLRSDMPRSSPTICVSSGASWHPGHG